MRFSLTNAASRGVPQEHRADLSDPQWHRYQWTITLRVFVDYRFRGPAVFCSKWKRGRLRFTFRFPVSASERQRKELKLRARLSFQSKFKLDSHPRFSEAPRSSVSTSSYVQRTCTECTAKIESGTMSQRVAVLGG